MTELTALREDPRLIRVFLESPILDERKWSKLPALPYDALLVDLEDSVPPSRKQEARARVVEVLNATTGRLQGLLVPRVNSLPSGFFEEDVAALAGSEISHLAYPMLNSVEELENVLAVLDSAGLRPSVFASIETARGVQNVDEIAGHPRVSALLLGPSDLGLDMGIPLEAAKDIKGPALQYARSRVIMAAAANQIACISMAFPRDMKDLVDTREQIDHGRRIGLTGMMTFYPPHVDLILDVFTPSADHIARAHEAVRVYEQAKEQGAAAAYLADGGLVLAFDYAQALETLSRHSLFEGKS